MQNRERVVLGALGITAGHDSIWRWLHTFSADVALFIVGLHVALHWRWVVNAVKRYVWQPGRGRNPRLQPQLVTVREQAGMR